MARQETWSYSTWFGKCSIQCAYNVSSYDVFRFDSTVVIYVLINISYYPQSLNSQIFKNFEVQSG